MRVRDILEALAIGLILWFMLEGMSHAYVSVRGQYTVGPSSDTITIAPTTRISFKWGELRWDDGYLEFSGHMRKSGRAFLEYLKPRIDTYIDSEVERRVQRELYERDRCKKR